MRNIVVLPTNNEKENILGLIGEILNLDNDLDILVVDDDSMNGTGRLVDSIASQDSRVKVIHRRERLGRGAAGIEGFKYALKENYDYILEMDADCSHNPKYIPKFLDEIKNSDVVIGSRRIKGGEDKRNISRKSISTLANFYIRSLLGIKVKDCTSGFRCFKRKVLECISLDNMISKGPSIVEEILYACYLKGYKITEIPITFDARKKGRTKLNLKRLINAFFMVLRSRRNKKRQNR